MNDKCKDCGSLISESATKCPKCGSSHPLGFGAFLGFLSVMFLLTGIGSFSTDNKFLCYLSIALAVALFFASRSETQKRKQRRETPSIGNQKQ
ncbi:MAG: hypothetical protein KQH59_18390 [Desulfobulbaceae bacterium]|nr:hypothetical protein [Desulfobulbaceae bacterium]